MEPYRHSYGQQGTSHEPYRQPYLQQGPALEPYRGYNGAFPGRGGPAGGRGTGYQARPGGRGAPYQQQGPGRGTHTGIPSLPENAGVNPCLYLPLRLLALPSSKPLVTGDSLSQLDPRGTVVLFHLHQHPSPIRSMHFVGALAPPPPSRNSRGTCLLSSCICTLSMCVCLWQAFKELSRKTPSMRTDRGRGVTPAHPCSPRRLCPCHISLHTAAKVVLLMAQTLAVVTMPLYLAAKLPHRLRACRYLHTSHHI